jgi:hypothetical protein
MTASTKISIDIGPMGLGMIVISAPDPAGRAEAHEFLAKNQPALDQLDKSLKGRPTKE